MKYLNIAKNIFIYKHVERRVKFKLTLLSPEGQSSKKLALSVTEKCFSYGV